MWWEGDMVSGWCNYVNPAHKDVHVHADVF